jgi:hypothetical protein
MAKSNHSTTFSVLFSDLMMGAMGVIIVLITFLQITTVRGMAISSAQDSVRLPPGFRNDAAKKFAKVRVVVCGAGKEVIGFSARKDIRQYASKVNNNCLLKVYIFDEGLGSGSQLLKAQSDVKGRTSVDVQVSISGYTANLSNTIVRQIIEDNDTLATINLDKEEVLYAN